MYQSFPQKHYNRSNTAMPVIKEPPCEKKEIKCEKEIGECCETKQNNPLGNIFGSLEIEDLILIGIILILLYEGTNDFLIIALLGVILFLPE